MTETEATAAVRNASAPMTESDVQYDAFFSYTTGADAKLVRRTERFLEGFHRQHLLRKLHLKRLSICVDGSDFRPRFGDTIESVDQTLRRYVGLSRYLVVFCSPAAARSPYVDLEIRVFLENHPPSAVLPVLTAGDPSGAAEQSFPKALIEREYHKAIWLDFRGARTWWWRRRTLRIRPFKEERVKLAAELHGKAPDILPAWKRAEIVRRRLAAAAVACVVALASAAWWQSNRNYARTIAGDVSRAIDAGGGASIQELQRRAVDAVARLHVAETDAAYRQAASLALHRSGAPVQPIRAPHVLSANSATSVRLARGSLEVTDNIQGGAWRSLLAGQFTHVDVSDDGATVAALDAVGLVVWRNGVASRCSGQPPDAIGRTVAVDATGARVAALFQSAQTWSIALGSTNNCSARPLNVLPLWTMATSPADGGGLRSSPQHASVRVKLSPGGRAVIASSDAGWLLANVRDDPGDPLESLNRRLEDAWRADLPEASTGAKEVPLFITDEAFSGDGQYAAVAATRMDGRASRLDPSALLMPLHGADEPIRISASRGTRQLAVARTAPILAFATTDLVRIWNWSLSPRLASFRVSGAGVAALAFGAGDRLLVVADDALQPQVYALDAPTGILLTKTAIGDVQVSSIIPGGAGGTAALIQFAAAAAGSALYELRPLDVVARLAKAEEHLLAAALLNPAGVAVSGNSKTLRIAHNDEKPLHAIPLPDLATHVTASKDAVFVLLGSGRLLRCPLAQQRCEDQGEVDPDVRSIAVDESGTLFLGCVGGGVVVDRQQCREAGAAPDVSAAGALAVSATSVLRIGGNRACVSSRRDLGSCDLLPTGKERIVTGAVSSGGAAVATAVETDKGGAIDIYTRSLQRWFPWPTWRYGQRSRILALGDVAALAFSADGSWIRAVSVWDTFVVVRCFPVTIAAVQQVKCPDE